MQNKNAAELKNLETELTQTLRGGKRAQNTGFYETVLKLLKPKYARTRLKEAHAEKLNLRLQRIRADQQRATEEHERSLPTAKPEPKNEANDEKEKPHKVPTVCKLY